MQHCTSRTHLVKYVYLHTRLLQVMTKEGEWIASATEIPKTSSNQIKATMFSPSEDGNTFHLERWYVHLY